MASKYKWLVKISTFIATIYIKGLLIGKGLVTSLHLVGETNISDCLTSDFVVKFNIKKSKNSLFFCFFGVFFFVKINLLFSL